MESFTELVKRSRSIRRFDESTTLTQEQLAHITAPVPYIPCGGNAQPLKYYRVTGTEACKHVFPLLHWAAYLKEWPGPAKGERPTAYIVALNDTTIKGPATRDVDLGIAAQTIALSAAEIGIGSCIIQSFNKPQLAQVLNLPGYLQPMMVIALGIPAETVVLEPVQKEGTIAYYRDENSVHHVPKRLLSELLLP